MRIDRCSGCRGGEEGVSIQAPPSTETPSYAGTLCEQMTDTSKNITFPCGR